MYIGKLIIGVVFDMAIFAGLLLLPAKTWAWGRAWVFLGVVFIATVATVVSLPRELLDERMKPLVQKGQPLADKLLVLLLVATFCGVLVFIPLDVFPYNCWENLEHLFHFWGCSCLWWAGGS
jgi:hypothetical protein